MEEKTLYVSENGFRFSDPDKCRRYESLSRKWEEAYLLFLEDFDGNTDLREFHCGPTRYSRDLDDEAEVDEFFKKLELLKALSAFMAEG